MGGLANETSKLAIGCQGSVGGDHKIGVRLSYSLADIHTHTHVYTRTDRRIYVQGMHTPPIITTTSVMSQASLANRAS